MKSSIIIAYIASAIIITTIVLLIYASVQQTYRNNANDPQIQVARDLSIALENNKSTNKFLEEDAIDLAQSLATFTEIFDATGKPVQSTGFINGQLPQPPKGVFEFTVVNKEDILTWQPQQAIRLAMVFEKVSDKGFVAVGRSLQETEIRTGNLVKIIFLAWITCMFVLALHLLIRLSSFKRTLNNS